MTLTTLLTNIAIAAIILTLLMWAYDLFFLKKQKENFDQSGNETVTNKGLIKSLPLSLLQNFCGILFVFSGKVKADDPLGTAYKMKDYFGEFESLFQGTAMDFLAPIFPVMSEYAVGFSVAMIVFEIVLGLMLIMGHAPKFTKWAFLLLVLFFTVLTGFTYLTGYVPNDAHFFEFSKWAAHDENNMKVKDCGCFGDYIKLVPFTSFMKDIFLLIPAFIFLFASKKMHTLFSKPIRRGIVALSLVGVTLYCFSNYIWDIPGADHRPFRKGTNVKAIKDIEEAALAKVVITDWEMKHNETGEVIRVPNAEYMGKDPNKNYSFYKGVYTVTDQIRSKPAIEATKISDFIIEDKDGNDLTDDIIAHQGANLLIVNYKLKGEGVSAVRTVRDSVFVMDTVSTEPLEVVKRLETVVEKQEEYTDNVWKPDYLKKHAKLKNFTDAAKQAGLPVVMAIGGADELTIADFNEDTGLNLTYGMADDILLKTIVRSNPGVVLFKDGVIVDKWHIKKLPSFDKVKGEYLN